MDYTHYVIVAELYDCPDTKGSIKTVENIISANGLFYFYPVLSLFRFIPAMERLMIRLYIEKYMCPKGCILGIFAYRRTFIEDIDDSA